MSRTARASSPSNALQERVRGWVKKLLPVLPPDPHPTEFTAFSPIKREKHAGSAGRGTSPTVYHAARVVLRLLGEIVVSEKFSTLSPELLETGIGPALTAAEIEA